jgi:rubrerythrin
MVVVKGCRMTTWLTIDEVLKRGIEREIHSQKLYAGLAEKVNSPAAKDALGKLVIQEKKHQEMLEKYARGELKDGELGSRKPIDYHIVEYLDRPEIVPDVLLKDVWLIAASREKLAYEFYIGLAGVHPPGKARRLLGELAMQELEHKHVLESLYAQVQSPQPESEQAGQ